jgi:hypothetical protein
LISKVFEGSDHIIDGSFSGSALVVVLEFVVFAFEQFVDGLNGFNLINRHFVPAIYGDSLQVLKNVIDVLPLD